MGQNEELAKKIFSVIQMVTANERIVFLVAQPKEKQAMAQNGGPAKKIFYAIQMENASQNAKFWDQLATG